VNSPKENRNMALNSSMAEALRLTRSGNLMEATAMIQAALGAGDSVFTPPTGKAVGGLIDLLPDQGVWRAGASPEPRREATPSGVDSVDARARFEEQVYRGSEGSMSYRLYRPAQATAGMPLVVMLHGCTQSPEDFARGTGMNRLADEFGFLVAYPQQSQSANLQKCWNWFKPGDQQRDRGEPALLAGITRDVMATHDVDPSRVYVAGLSAGGAAAAIMAAEYPDIYAAVGIHSGLACGVARDLPSALAAMKRGGAAGTTRAKGRFVPVITFHGDRDATVHEVNSREIIAAASAAAGVPLDIRIQEGRSKSGRPFTQRSSVGPEGTVLIEQWTIGGSGHAWSGGDPAGSYTDPSGPEASREMVRFFLEQKRPSSSCGDSAPA
jgi:poly(hydroxyalkanoate) depolymerase family esterase